MKRTIKDIIEPAINAPVECDGFSRIALRLLYDQHIEAKLMRGTLYNISEPAKSIDVHFWLECFGYVVDYRAECWLGKGAPHGIYTPEEVHQLGFEYTGEQVSEKPMKPEIMRFVMTDFESLLGGQSI
ncbi:hypothetical protein MHM93_14825 [Pseudoalteromonas sp. MM17-2]|uniref:hypothetical protein n=1 Tax=Pseudoalteromonas sp. MM17-2 TaxID=2917753 RepID=UPI001EF6FE58|nr:hypothetical protein [Pseudoalteromonas sp. MM17-2]MCG7545453.1 hypothetical protein [Pseudoalteromonas sp. MM17-2]